jgi:MFS family permease
MRALGRDEQIGENPPWRHVLAVVIGNGLEFYDFIVFAFFATEIGRQFFPSEKPFGSLLAALATFGIGFVFRPLGALAFGWLGDKVGRKPAMIASFVTMTTAMLVMALTPPAAQWGLAAQIVFVGARIVQGFALGGEVGPSTALLMEIAPPEKRGLYTSWQASSQNISGALGGAVGVALSLLLDPAQLESFGWRIAFLIGVAALPLGFWLRRALPETLHVARAPDAPPRPERVGFARTLVCTFLMLASGTVATYCGLYMTTFARTFLHVGDLAAFGVQSVQALVSIAATLGWMHLSDNFGRKPVYVGSSLVLAVAIMPVFFAITGYKTVFWLYLGNVVLALLASGAAVLFVQSLELTPGAVRARAFGLNYALAISLFGGSTQFVVTWLIARTGDPNMPGWYWLGATAVGLLAGLALPESAPVVSAREKEKEKEKEKDAVSPAA